MECVLFYMCAYIDTYTLKGKKSGMLSCAFWYKIIEGEENPSDGTNIAAVFKS